MRRQTVAGRSSLAYPALGHPRSSPRPFRAFPSGPLPRRDLAFGDLEGEAPQWKHAHIIQTTPLHGGHFTDKEGARLLDQAQLNPEVQQAALAGDPSVEQN